MNFFKVIPLKTIKVVPWVVSVKSRRHQSISPNSIHSALGWPIFLGQIFGLMPVCGILEPSPKDLRFKYISWRFLYAIGTLSGAVFLTSVQLHKILHKEKLQIFFEVDRLMFFVAGIISCLMFINLARVWPKLMKEWFLVELEMSGYGWPANLRRNINLHLFFFMAIALVEHCLTQSNKLVLAIECKDGDIKKALTYFIGKMSFSHLFSLFEFAIWKGIIIQLINLQSTFFWTYGDTFIMILSIGLASRFEQVTKKLKIMVHNKVIDQDSWRLIREDYNRLCVLCQTLDKCVDFIVLQSFAVNIFFILMQLFNSLKAHRNDLERVYVYFSFGLLILRTLCVCLVGGKIHNESLKPAFLLNSVPSHGYNVEVRRFIQQVSLKQTALTGKKIFNVTRSLVLNIAGAIVTYELVFIQFNEKLLKVDEADQTTKCPVFV